MSHEYHVLPIIVDFIPVNRCITITGKLGAWCSFHCLKKGLNPLFKTGLNFDFTTGVSLKNDNKTMQILFPNFQVEENYL